MLDVCSRKPETWKQRVVMKLEKFSGETPLYPIIGDPIRFVKSPHRLTAKFEELGHNCICVPILVPEGALESVV